MAYYSTINQKILFGLVLYGKPVVKNRMSYIVFMMPLYSSPVWMLVRSQYDRVYKRLNIRRPTVRIFLCHQQRPCYTLLAINISLRFTIPTVFYFKINCFYFRVKVLLILSQWSFLVGSVLCLAPCIIFTSQQSLNKEIHALCLLSRFLRV